MDIHYRNSVVLIQDTGDPPLRRLLLEYAVAQRELEERDQRIHRLQSRLRECLKQLGTASSRTANSTDWSMVEGALGLQPGDLV